MVVSVQEYLEEEGKSPFARWFVELVVLLGGGSKKRQSADIAVALACWQDYKKRKR